MYILSKDIGLAIPFHFHSLFSHSIFTLQCVLCLFIDTFIASFILDVSSMCFMFSLLISRRSSAVLLLVMSCDILSDEWSSAVLVLLRGQGSKHIYFF